MSEKAYERYAWILLVGVYVVFALFALGDIALGTEADPAIVEGVTGVPLSELRAMLEALNPRLVDLFELSVRTGGGWMLGFSLLGAAVSATAFKRGERWAWYALWSLPLVIGLNLVIGLSVERAPGAPIPPPLVSAPVFLIIIVLGLLLPYRKFFPSK